MALKIAYLALTLLALIFLFAIGYKAIKATSRHIKTDLLILIFGLGLWQIYIQQLSSTELLKTFDFPPRFALAFILPSFIFTGLFLFRHRKSKWLDAIPQSWLIYFQSFRIIVEILFVLTVAKGLIHPEVTIEGYNFDMIFALTAPLMAYMVYQKKAWPKKAIIVWNYLGLVVLASVIFLFMASIYKPSIFGETEVLLPLSAIEYPYILIAGFFMPIAVFLHILSLVQLGRDKK